MNYSLIPGRKTVVLAVSIVVIVLAIVLVKNRFETPAKANSAESESAANSKETAAEATVDLSDSQLKAIQVEPLNTYAFAVEKEAVGSIAYYSNGDASKPPAGRNEESNNESAVVAATDSTTKWLVANVQECDIPAIHEGDSVVAHVEAFPDRVFNGKIIALGGSIWDSGDKPAIDPNTRRVTVRCKINDPKNELYPGMLASITIQVQDPVESVSIPLNGVVRNGDGTIAAWVTTDHHRFHQRIVKIGLQKNGLYQILYGLQPGELAVTDGAVFLSNILYAPPDD